jgi:hypothetical protein
MTSPDTIPVIIRQTPQGPVVAVLTLADVLSLLKAQGGGA